MMHSPNADMDTFDLRLARELLSSLNHTQDIPIPNEGEVKVLIAALGSYIKQLEEVTR